MHDDPDSPSPALKPADRTAPRGLFQSARADYSIRWTETGLLVPAPAGSDGDWPSDRWRAHLAECGPARGCRHRVPEPGWWVLMAGRGVPLHPDAQKARDLANGVISRFRGHPRLPDALLAFTQEAVRDALIIAPQPVCEAWVKSALAVVGMLVRSVAADDGPLTREHVFSESARDRFLYFHLRGHKDTSVNNYRGRLDLIVMALSGVTVREPGSQPSLRDSEPLTPLTPQEEAALYLWAAGLRPDQRRKRTVATVTLGLGVGPRTPELLPLTREDVSIDAGGAHVRLTNTDGLTRVVTCRREWEDRLIELVNITAPGHMLIAPWRSTALSNGNYSMTTWRTQERFTPPAYFSARLLRNTWLVRQMEAGTPISTMLTAADLSSGESLFRMLPFCRVQDPVAAAASLRGVRA